MEVIQTSRQWSTVLCPSWQLTQSHNVPHRLSVAEVGIFPVLWGTFHGIEQLVHHDSTLQTLHIQQGHLPALTDIIISNYGVLALGFTCIYMIMDRICTVHIGASDLSLTHLCFALDTPHAYTWVNSLPVRPNNNESRSTHREGVYFWTINKTPTLTTHRAGLTNRW